MIRFDPLLAPVIIGVEETTRIRYPDPAVVPTGIVQEIVPELATEFNVPISTPGEKAPLEFDN